MSDVEAVVAALDRHGLLLLQDKRLPSVVGLITGEAVSGSWWAHPLSHRIFACVQQLTHRRDVMAAHLVDRKVTFVHRRLWPAVMAVGECGEPWQMRGLSADARDLLRQVQATRSLRATGPAARQLQERLLVHGDEEHTESGHHAHLLRTWDEWRRSRALPPGTGIGGFEGQLMIETALRNAGGDPKHLPWRRRAHAPL